MGTQMPANVMGNCFDQKTISPTILYLYSNVIETSCRFYPNIVHGIATNVYGFDDSIIVAPCVNFAPATFYQIQTQWA